MATKTFADLSLQNLTLATKALTEDNSIANKLSYITGQKIIDLVVAQGFLTQMEIEALTSLPYPNYYIGGGHIKVAYSSNIICEMETTLKCRDVANTYNLSIATGFTKLLNVAWTVGAGGGGLDTGTIDNNRIYYAYIIYNATSDTTDMIYSLDPLTPTLPSGYVYYRRVGAVYWDYYITSYYFKVFQWYDFKSYANLSDGHFIKKLPNDYLSNNLSITYNSGTNLITVYNTEASDDENEYDLYLLQDLSKDITATWSEGKGFGCLDTGSLADDTQYYIFLIYNFVTGAIDVLLSTSATAPTMPTGYTHKRLIGYLYSADYSGSGEIFVWNVAKPINIASYFEVQANSNATTITTSDTWTKLTWDAYDVAESIGFGVSTINETEVLFLGNNCDECDLTINISLSVSFGAANKNAEFGIVKNGTFNVKNEVTAGTVIGSAFQRFPTSGQSENVYVFCKFSDVQVGDIFSIVGKNVTDTTNLTVERMVGEILNV